MEWNLKYIVVYLTFWIVVEAARGIRECPPLRLRNGSVRLRPSGRIAKFRCNYPYKLVGNSYAQCLSINRKWEEPMPICIKAGCAALPAIANGILDITHDGSLARFVCHYGFELEGPREIFCNGFNWNDTVPKCRGTKELSKLGCNFDSGLCGWDDDELHDFNWRRKAGGDFLVHLDWYPAKDHTNSSTSQGAYVYIERQTVLEHQSARLLSPSYHSDLTKNGCFTFYYYRSSNFRGVLNVYQKPDSINMTTLIASEQGRKYLRFELAISDYAQWIPGFFYLTEMDEDFQIVIEGETNKFQFVLIAVDDVMILQGQQCNNNTNIITTTESMISPVLKYSCVNRCGTQPTLPSPRILELKICGCEESCLQTDTCCSDYRDLCEFGEDTTTEEMTTESETIVQTTPTIMKKSYETTHFAITYPISRNLVTEWSYRKPTDQPKTSSRFYTPFYKRTNTTQTTITRIINNNITVPISKATTASKPSTITKMTNPNLTYERTPTEKPIAATTKKVTPTLTSSKTSKQVSTASTKVLTSSAVSMTTNTTKSISIFTSTTRQRLYQFSHRLHIVLSTIRPRPYEADGKTAQVNQTNISVTAGRTDEDEKTAYYYRMHVTTICVAVFLCICGASILIMFIVKRRDQIRSLMTRLGISHEYAKSHVGKEGEVRFLIRKDEVDFE